MEPIRFLLVGCGMMGARHARGLAELERTTPGKVRLAAVCDMRQDIAEKVAAEAQQLFGARPQVFTDLDKRQLAIGPAGQESTQVYRKMQARRDEKRCEGGKRGQGKAQPPEDCPRRRPGEELHRIFHDRIGKGAAVLRADQLECRARKLPAPEHGVCMDEEPRAIQGRQQGPECPHREPDGSGADCGGGRSERKCNCPGESRDRECRHEPEEKAADRVADKQIPSRARLEPCRPGPEIGAGITHGVHWQPVPNGRIAGSARECP